jgi:hypothetical protein
LVPFLNDPATLLNLPDLFIPANAMVALFIGVSVAGVYDSLQSLRPSSAWVLTGLLSLPLAIFISGIYLAHEPAQAAARARAADSSVYSKALLRHVPPNSTVFAGWSFATPLWYYQKVEGLGPDVRVLALWPDEWADHIAAAPPDEVIYLTHQPQGVVQGLPAVNVLQHDWMTAYKVAREADYLLQETPAVQHPFSINVSNQITFLGYNLEPTVVTPGGSFEIQYFWRARVPMKRDYEIFVHFVDSQDQIVFQQDHLPVGGVYPTQQWSRGDVVRESYVTIVPKEVRPGSYRILIGMWDPVENARLRVFGVAQYKDAIVLDGVTVSPQGE